MAYAFAPPLGMLGLVRCSSHSKRVANYTNVYQRIPSKSEIAGRLADFKLSPGSIRESWVGGAEPQKPMML